MVDRSAATRNHLLARLPAPSLDSLLPKLQAVALDLHDVIATSNGILERVIFPQTGMISLVANLADGMQAEVGLIGREGMFGATLLFGVETTFTESVVQLQGIGLRMSASDFRTEIEANAPFRALLLLYSETLQAQITQTAACNGRHELEQRLARWLLTAVDRAESLELHLTQEFLAMMLCVHRPTLSVTAGILQRAGLIKHRAGVVKVLDRDGLEASSCECYQAVKAHAANIMRLP